MCDPPQPQRLAVRQVAAELGVSPQTIYRLFHAGKLLGLQVETAVRIDRASLDEYIAAHRNVQPQVETSPPGAVAAERPEPPPTPPPSPRRKATRREKGFRFFPPV